MATCPKREEIIDLLKKLCRGEASREDVAAWAMEIIDDDSIRVSDQRVWEILRNLGAADLPLPNQGYLYVEEDFQDWIYKLTCDK